MGPLATAELRQSHRLGWNCFVQKRFPHTETPAFDLKLDRLDLALSVDDDIRLLVHDGDLGLAVGLAGVIT